MFMSYLLKTTCALFAIVTISLNLLAIGFLLLMAWSASSMDQRVWNEDYNCDASLQSFYYIDVKRIYLLSWNMDCFVADTVGFGGLNKVENTYVIFETSDPPKQRDLSLSSIPMGLLLIRSSKPIILLNGKNGKVFMVLKRDLLESTDIETLVQDHIVIR